jgi:mRNA interferase MazF
VLIVQEDSFAETASIAVCLLTRTRIESEVARQVVEPSPENGLRETSYVMVDKITTVPRARLGRRIGTLKAGEMAAINRAMMVFLGLAG